MGVLIEYHFQCDFCDEKVTEKQTYHRYEEMWQPYSPSGYDRSWFWPNSDIIACPKHWEALREFILTNTRSDA